MKKIAVTGGSGASGRVIVDALAEEGHEVVNIDAKRFKSPNAEYREVDLASYGDVFSALHGADAIVHFAANPEPDFDHFTGAQRFHNNLLSTFNVLNAARALGVQRVVWASSETVYGFPFDTYHPPSAPVDENTPVAPQNAYAVAKVAGEKTAEHYATLTGGAIIGLRLANILYLSDHRDTYDKIPSYWTDPYSRKFNMWTYVDARDVAQAVVRGLSADVKGAHVYNITAADTIMSASNEELIKAVFPDTKLDPETGPHDTLLKIDKARRELGYAPKYSWREIL